MKKKCKYILSIFVTMILIVTIETNAFADRTLLIPELPKQPSVMVLVLLKVLWHILQLP